ncbi:DUF167 family protein YggU [Shewanella dokdonensis]|uniref:UPF0235 protein KHX94_04205 n=1 Tax=Shewanella dokdonensis TaxID=712036 RepID=A0ABX8DGM1_9GAMM|nr:DUF167 family protein YggU [Shewanella dokdonensis]MCL1074144.1 DUF167 family protein YggU [Shewanella dokdonensis]QVK23876.1 YggU family protein [Shewanella dokdonensis]
MPAIVQEQQDLLLNLYIQPKASRDQWVGIHGDEVKLAITAPPIDGKANAYLAKWLAKAFKVPKSQVTIIKGELGRHKQVRISAPKALPEFIQQLL